MPQKNFNLMSFRKRTCSVNWRSLSFWAATEFRDGYAYAIEHMSEPNLREQAISALAEIREPRTVGELRKILEMSNDNAWNSAAVRALGALGASDFAPRFLEMARSRETRSALRRSSRPAIFTKPRRLRLCGRASLHETPRDRQPAPEPQATSSPGTRKRW